MSYAIDPNSLMESYYLVRPNDIINTDGETLVSRVDVGYYEYIIVDIVCSTVNGEHSISLQAFDTPTGGTGVEIESIDLNGASAKRFLRAYRVADLAGRWFDLETTKVGTNFTAAITLTGLRHSYTDDTTTFNQDNQTEIGVS